MSLTHSLTYSILTHIKTSIPVLKSVAWIYDGITISGREKPFMSVEQMPGSNTNLSKDRTQYEETFRYQIGLYATSMSERTKLEETVKTILRQPKIVFLNTSGATPIASGFFYCDLLSMTPLPVESVADETNKHRVYFDIEVVVHRTNGDGIAFTQ